MKMKKLYVFPVIERVEMSYSQLLSQQYIVDGSAISAVPACGGTAGGCEQGNDSGFAGMILFLCVEGVSSDADLVGGVTISAGIPCVTGTDEISLNFPACSVAASDAQSACPAGSIPITCAQTFNCDVIGDVCAGQGGEQPNSGGPAYLTVNGHQCTNFLDIFGDGGDHQQN
ncbi:MAG: hypothetical protein Q8Q33_02250 [Chlamydiota bacterium]|nr:hypothetical protein [Chlamydiota bacterium]